VIVFDGEKDLTLATSGYLLDLMIQKYTIPKLGESTLLAGNKSK
jgi:hypothetical protein